MSAGALERVGAESHPMAPEEKRKVQIGEDGTMGLGRWWKARREGVGGARRNVSAWTVVFDPVPCNSASFRFC